MKNIYEAKLAFLRAMTGELYSQNQEIIKSRHAKNTIAQSKSQESEALAFRIQ